MLTYAGILLGSHFSQLDRYVGPVAVAVTALIVVAYLYRVVTWKPRHAARG